MTQKSTRVTMKDVASIADVSVQTVSRVINDHPDVASDTRKKVKDIVDQVGYRPNVLARSLISQRSYTLGVAIAGLKFIGPSTLLNGIAAAAEAAGYSLLLKELPSFDTENIEHIFNAFLSRQVDGIIWAVSEVSENRNWINQLPENYTIPLVCLTMEPKNNVTVVSVNNYLGGRLAATHLLEQGYQHIGHLSGPLEWWESRQRMMGWEDVLKEAGREIDDRHWVSGDWSSTSGAKAVVELLANYPEIDAILSANDQMALGALQILHQRNVRVPEDIGIVGFDNIQESAYFWPSLTTIQQKQRLVGKAAVEEVIKIIELDWQGLEPVAPKSILLEPALIVRQSSQRRERSKIKEVRK